MKRGDIGSTGDDYAEAWIDRDGPFRADAMTVSPYLGYGSLRGTVHLARANGAGVFVLAATSNPEARVLQTAVLAEGPRAGRTVAAGIVEDVADDNRTAGDAPLGDVGLVLGATLDLGDFGISGDDIGTRPCSRRASARREPASRTSGSLYGSRAEQVLVNESRGLLVDGPDGVAAARRRPRGPHRRRTRGRRVTEGTDRDTLPAHRNPPEVDRVAAAHARSLPRRARAAVKAAVVAGERTPLEVARAGGPTRTPRPRSPSGSATC